MRFRIPLLASLVAIIAIAILAVALYPAGPASAQTPTTRRSCRPTSIPSTRLSGFPMSTGRTGITTCAGRTYISVWTGAKTSAPPRWLAAGFRATS